MNLKEMYENNADFRGFVDRYCNPHTEGKSITVEEALTHKAVANYADYLEELKA